MEPIIIIPAILMTELFINVAITELQNKRTPRETIFSKDWLEITPLVIFLKNTFCG